MDFAVPVNDWVKLEESETRDKYVDLAREMKKQRNMKVTVIPIVQSPKIGTGTGVLGNKRTSGEHPNYSTIEIGQNTEKSPGELRRLAITQTPVGNHQLTHM